MPQHKCVGNLFNYKARTMYAQNGTCCPHSPISTHIHVLLCWGSSLLMYYSQLLQVTPSAPTAAGYAEWRPGAIYTDFHLLAKKPRNYRVVNTSVRMGAENLYFWLLTFVKKKVLRMVFTVLNYLVNSQQSSISLTVRSPEV